jgi:hypothetical protein
MKQALHDLAKVGFHRLSGSINPFADEVAMFLSEQNIAGMVTSSSNVVGLNQSLWGSATYGLVPCTQSMRLAITKGPLSLSKAEEDK